MTTHAKPKLAPPGAGLPAVELLFVRLMFAWKRFRANRETINASFRAERRRIRALIFGRASSLQGGSRLAPRQFNACASNPACGNFPLPGHSDQACPR